MKKLFIYLSLLAVVVLSVASCGQFELPGLELVYSDEIVFASPEPIFGVNTITKATPVTISDLDANGFLVDCVTGAEGSDTAVWSNVSFTKSGSYWKGDMFWPESAVTYRFYAVYPESYTMTPAAGGPTIAASNAHDIVCAYASSPTYKTVTDLSFEHIFAKIGTLTVTAAYPYTISDMSVMITPNVSGTYNLYTGAGQSDGTGWSSLVAGSPVDIGTAAFSESVSVTNANLYLVPGKYTLTFTWTASSSGYEETFTDIFVNVDLVAGKTNNITATLAGRGTDVEMNVSVSSMDNRLVAAGLVPRDNPSVIGGLVFSAAPLYYGEDGFEIKDADWEEARTNVQACQVYGQNNGSYFFNYAEVCSFSSLSYGDYTDWRVPTKDDIELVFSGPRDGAVVNGSSGKRYAGVDSPSGVLLFPDGKTFTGASLSNTNNGYTNSLTREELDSYIEQGAVYIPKVKNRSSGGWGSETCYYATSSKPSSNWYGMRINPGSTFGTGYIYSTTSSWVPVYLVRNF